MRTSTRTFFSATFAGALIFGAAACSSDSDTKDATATLESSPTSESSSATTETTTDATTDPTDTATSTPTETASEEPTTSADSGDVPAILQEMVDQQNEAIKPQLESLEAIFDEVKIEAKAPSGIVYSYRYAMDIPAEEAAKGIESGETTLESTAQSILPGMESAGLANPSVTFVYLNKDGSEIWSKEYTN